MGLFSRHRRTHTEQGEQSVTGLSLPPRAAPAPDAFDANPRHVAAWVENLPLANIGQTSRELYRALREINRTNMPVLTRIKAAEQLRRPVHYVADNLERHFIGPALPLSEKTRKISRLHRELWIELGLSYRIALDDLLARDGRSADKKLLAVALHRSLFYASQLILDLCLTYHVIPSKIWRELNMLYLLAEKNRLHQASVDDPEMADEDGRTVAEQFKRILLFVAADPFSISQPDIKRTYLFLREHADRAQLLTTEHGDDEPNQSFVIDLWSNRAPRHQRLFRDKPTRTQRILQTSALAEWLQRRFDAIATGETANAEEPSQRLLRRLLQRWGTGPKRQMTRTQMGLELDLATGLANIHRLLNGEERAAPGAQLPSSAVESLFNRRGNDPWKHLDSGNLSMAPMDSDFNNPGTVPADMTTPTLSPDSLPGLSVPSAGDSAIPDTFACQSLNESAGGYCVQWRGRNMPKIKIGELMGIQSPKSPEVIGVGICRWIKVRAHDELQLGMQVIAPQSLACRINLTDREMATVPALLVPEMRAANRQASLITDTMPFEVGSVVRIARDSNINTVRLTRLLESSGSFRQFQFVDLDKPSAVETSASEEEFSGLWQAL